MAAACLPALLLEAPIDEQQSHLDCVLDHCSPPALLALSRCCSQLHQAVGPPLQRAEQESAEQLCRHIGSSIKDMAAAAAVTWRTGLSRPHCRHLGALLRPGCALEGVMLLTQTEVGEEDEDEEDEQDVKISLDWLRNGATAIRLAECGMTDEMLMVIALPMGALASLTILELYGNQIGDEGMKAFSSALSSGSLDTLTYLYLYNNPASNSAKDTMKAVASNRSISLSI